MNAILIVKNTDELKQVSGRVPFPKIKLMIQCSPVNSNSREPTKFVLIMNLP